MKTKDNGNWWRNRYPRHFEKLARKDVDIAAIVTVADDGGSSGELERISNS